MLPMVCTVLITSDPIADRMGGMNVDTWATTGAMYWSYQAPTLVINTLTFSLAHWSAGITTPVRTSAASDMSGAAASAAAIFTFCHASAIRSGASNVDS